MNKITLFIIHTPFYIIRWYLNKRQQSKRLFIISISFIKAIRWNMTCKYWARAQKATVSQLRNYTCCFRETSFRKKLLVQRSTVTTTNQNTWFTDEYLFDFNKKSTNNCIWSSPTFAFSSKRKLVKWQILTIKIIWWIDGMVIKM